MEEEAPDEMEMAKEDTQERKKKKEAKEGKIVFFQQNFFKNLLNPVNLIFNKLAEIKQAWRCSLTAKRGSHKAEIEGSTPFTAIFS